MSLDQQGTLLKAVSMARRRPTTKRAWEILEGKYGHPFKIQEAFREKLFKWLKIGLRDGVGLQSV